MKISEVVSALEDIMSVAGDLEVGYHNEDLGCYITIETIRARVAERSGHKYGDDGELGQWFVGIS